ncbi:hypothetical protein [Mycobacterium sp. URHD0025]|uniref:hypothetical protein n=1 Tax=Mycobacterium sp. URHD0025 TaxID=1298864 RepID=UPI00041EFA95|nr:hypothetical protein [Mycobacterium sp. URHD0025]
MAEHKELAGAKDAEIAKLRAEVKKAQTANEQSDDRDYTEAETRDTFIDLMLQHRETQRRTSRRGCLSFTLDCASVSRTTHFTSRFVMPTTPICGSCKESVG